MHACPRCLLARNQNLIFAKTKKLSVQRYRNITFGLRPRTKTYLDHLLACFTKKDYMLLPPWNGRIFSREDGIKTGIFCLSNWSLHCERSDIDGSLRSTKKDLYHALKIEENSFPLVDLSLPKTHVVGWSLASYNEENRQLRRMIRPDSTIPDAISTLRTQYFTLSSFDVKQIIQFNNGSLHCKSAQAV